VLRANALEQRHVRETDTLARRFETNLGGYDGVVSPSSSCVGNVREHYVDSEEEA